MFFDQLERLFRLMLLASLTVLAISFFQKEKLPDPGFFSDAVLVEPRQTPTQKSPFETKVNNQTYTVTPLFEYELSGVVVTDYESGSFGDIYHHRKWKDFLNVKDLCVVWGQNITSGVFSLAYSSTSSTVVPTESMIVSSGAISSW